MGTELEATKGPYGERKETQPSVFGVRSARKVRLNAIHRSRSRSSSHTFAAALTGRRQKPFRHGKVSSKRLLPIGTNSRKRTNLRTAEVPALFDEDGYKKAIENSNDAVAVVKGDTHRYVNQRFVEMFGYEKPEEIIGRPLSLVVSPEDCRMVTDFSYARQEGGRGAERYEFRGTRKKGEPILVEASVTNIELQGEPHVLAFLRDVSDRKRLEEALQESEARYRSVVEGSLVGFHIIQDNRFRYVNSRFCEIHGYRYDELVNRVNPLDLVHKEDQGKVKESYGSSLARSKAHAETEFRTVRKDGKVVTLKVIGSRVMYRGRPAVSGTIIDITKERALETQLYHSQKLEAVGQLAGGIAHDFNNILSAIIGYTSLLQTKMDTSDPRRTYTDQILSSSHRAAHLTQSLLAFSRKQVIHLMPCKVNSIVTGVEKLLKRLLTEDIELKILPCQNDPTILADVTQIDQVLINLATNARDAMPNGGLLAIESFTVDVDNDFMASHRLDHTGPYVLISVSDNGIGMTEKTKDKIFEPFFTTKALGKGTGLGLSIVYGIVQQHNGCIDVYSKPGNGTSFNIYLPVVSNRATEQITEPVAALQRGTETILVAEDDVEVRQLIHTILSEHGYRIIEAEDGMEAINRFLGHQGEVGLVILDVVMPRKNGREVYEAINKTGSKTPVLFISGYTDDIIHEKGIEETRVEYIPKPVSPDSRLRKVREILDRQDLHPPIARNLHFS